MAKLACDGSERKGERESESARYRQVRKRIERGREREGRRES